MAFQGESHILRISFTDSEGALVAPSLPAITNVEARLLNRVSGEVAEKWSLTTQTGFEDMTIDGNYLVCYCPKAILEKKQIGNYDIQVNVTTPDANMTGGNVQIEKGELLNLLTASNG